MSDEQKCIKICRVEFSGSWDQDTPTALGAVKYSCNKDGGKMTITTSDGKKEEFILKVNRAVWVVNDMVHFPYAV